MKKQEQELVLKLPPAEGNGDAFELEETLAMTIGHLKRLHSTLSLLVIEVATIRRTVLGGPEEIALRRDHLRAAQEIAMPIVDEAMESLDEMIRKIGGGWEN